MWSLLAIPACVKPESNRCHNMNWFTTHGIHQGKEDAALKEKKVNDIFLSIICIVKLTESFKEINIQLSFLVRCLGDWSDVLYILGIQVQIDDICRCFTINSDSEKYNVSFGKWLTKGKLDTRCDHQCKNCISQLVIRMSQFIEALEDLAVFDSLGFGEQVRKNRTVLV